MFLLSITASLKLKTRPNQLLGSVPLDIVLLDPAYFTGAMTMKKSVITLKPGLCLLLEVHRQELPGDRNHGTGQLPQDYGVRHSVVCPGEKAPPVAYTLNI